MRFLPALMILLLLSNPILLPKIISTEQVDTDEIIIAIGGSPGGRAHARTGDRYQDMKEMGIKNSK